MIKRKGNEQPEYRSFPVQELRMEANEEGVRTLVGYAAVFDQWSEDLGGFREIIRPGAFSKTLSDGADVRALFNHDPNFVLGRTTSNTLRLSEDATGLRIEADLPDTQIVRDLVISPIERGDVSQMSFGFRTVKDKWSGEVSDKLLDRELFEVKLYDVSPVTMPAYPQTSVGVRSLPGEIDVDELRIAAFRQRLGVASDQDRSIVKTAIEELEKLIPAEPRQETHSDYVDELEARLEAIKEEI